MMVIFSKDVFDSLLRHKIYLSDNGSPRLEYGSQLFIQASGVAEPYSAVLAGSAIPTIGSFSFVSSGVFPEQVIGRYCSISWGLKIMGGAHPVNFLSTSQFSYDQFSKIYRQCIEDNGLEEFRYSHFEPTKPLPIIEHDVWIGQDVTLARGITLGTGCVVGAGSVVTKSVAPYTIVGGAPARVIRKRFPDGLARRLLSLCWWEYKFTDFNGMPHEKPVVFVDAIEKEIASGRISKFQPNQPALAEILASK